MLKVRFLKLAQKISIKLTRLYVTKRKKYMNMTRNMRKMSMCIKMLLVNRNRKLKKCET